jgi:hypothetical protein
MRLTHFSVQGNHIHLLHRGAARRALSAGAPAAPVFGVAWLVRHSTSGADYCEIQRRRRLLRNSTPAPITAKFNAAAHYCEIQRRRPLLRNSTPPPITAKFNAAAHYCDIHRHRRLLRRQPKSHDRTRDSR